MVNLAALPYASFVRVQLFIACLNDTFFPRIGVAVVRVLRHFGCEVTFPTEQTCCGQPAYNCGLHADARPVARRLLTVLAGDDPVVSPSASCVSMIRAHVPELLAGDRREHAAALALAARTHEFSVFLRDALRVDAAALLRPGEPYTYHYPCHARGIYELADFEKQLASAGGDVRPPRYRDMCCGFGGTFAVDYPTISGDMLGDRIDDLDSTGAKLAVCNEGGCTLNLRGGAHRRGSSLRFKHLAELLAESLGLLEPER